MSRETASEAYARRVKEIKEKMTLIENIMTLHAERQAKRPNDWGFAGDLAQVDEYVSMAASALLGR
jgi:hypothetical protein